MLSGKVTSSGLGPQGGPGSSYQDWFKRGCGGSYGGSGGASSAVLESAGITNPYTVSGYQVLFM